MAKILPAIEVTDAQFARVAAVLPGATAAQKTAAYTALVKSTLRRLVIDADVRQAEEDAREALEAARQAAADNPDNL